MHRRWFCDKLCTMDSKVQRLCKGCGVDISNRKADAKVCSRKCYNEVNRGRRNEINRACAKRRYQKNRKLLWMYLLEHPCENCGEDNPACLDLDHIDPALKVASISDVTMSWSWERIMKEIEKCRVLCANCHRIRTYDQFGWYKGEDIESLD